MDYKDKLKGNIAGYVAVFLWIVILVSNVYIMTMDIHFKYDVFVMLILVGIFESCRETYLDFRKREKEMLSDDE